jgi:hypothetical protein
MLFVHPPYPPFFGERTCSAAYLTAVSHQDEHAHADDTNLRRVCSTAQNGHGITSKITSDHLSSVIIVPYQLGSVLMHGDHEVNIIYIYYYIISYIYINILYHVYIYYIYIIVLYSVISHIFG